MTIPVQSSKVPTKVVISQRVVEQLDRYIAERNVELAPAELTRTAVVNDAISEYLARRNEGEGEEAAD